jgi:hypothetical protein
VTLPLAESISDWNKPFVTYAYRLYLEGHTGWDSIIRVESMRIRTVSQVAVASLPTLNASPWILSSSGMEMDGGVIRLEIGDQPYPADR